MKNKKSFVLYCDLIHTVNQLPDDKAGLLFKHILSYVNDENPITEDIIVKIGFEPIKQQLKRDLAKYEKKREQYSDAGKKSAEARRLKKLQEELESNENQQTLTNVEERSTNSTVNDNVTVNVNDNVIKEKEKKFLKFWELYPKKVNKKDSLKKWMSLSDKDIIEISKTIKSFINYKQFEDYTHPNPTTYLNQKRWEDEIPVVKDLSTETDEERRDRLTKEAQAE